jgi:hypothetical protein
MELDKELELIFTDDLEDEDKQGTRLASTKCLLLAVSPSIHRCPSYAAILKHHSNCFKPTSPLPGHIPELYILQGVFRI